MKVQELTDDELKYAYELIRTELENRNIEQGLPILFNINNLKGGTIKHAKD